MCERDLTKFGSSLGATVLREKDLPTVDETKVLPRRWTSRKGRFHHGDVKVMIQGKVPYIEPTTRSSGTAGLFRLKNVAWNDVIGVHVFSFYCVLDDNHKAVQCGDVPCSWWS